MYLLHVRFDSVGLLSARDILKYINILTDFGRCIHRRVNVSVYDELSLEGGM